jgi:hypothetical protein
MDHYPAVDGHWNSRMRQSDRTASPQPAEAIDGSLCRYIIMAFPLVVR